MPTHSPLPSFHSTPNHSPSRSLTSSPLLKGSSSSSLNPAPPGPSSSAVAEKVALSYHRARTSGSTKVRRCTDLLFVNLRIPLGNGGAGGGSANNGGGGGIGSSKRELSIPVLRVLHPSRPLPLSGVWSRVTASVTTRGGRPRVPTSWRDKAKRTPTLHSTTSPTSPSSASGAGSFSSQFDRYGAYPSHAYQHTSAGYGTTGFSPIRAFVAVVGTVVFVVVSLVATLRLGQKAFVAGRDSGKIPLFDPSTLVLTPAEVERVWRWEIAEGHYPSRRSPGISFNQVDGGGSVGGGGGGGGVGGGEGGTRITSQAVNAGLVRVENPGLPKRTEDDLRREREVKLEVERRLREQGRVVNQGSPGGGLVVGGPSSDDALRSNGVEVVPVGPGRAYLDMPLSKGRQSQPYPPRPLGQATLDLDAVMDHCDFAEGKYVRDCLEVLRVNGGLEPPLRRGSHDAWKTTFVPTRGAIAAPSSAGGAKDRLAPVSESVKRTLDRYKRDMTSLMNSSTSTFASLVSSRQQLTLTSGPSSMTHVRHAHFTPHASHPTADPACDPAHPRLFHIFWAGPFTDKPYSAALSFLFTQRLALSSPIGADPTLDDPSLCRPQLWIWINPGPASSFPDPRAERRMRNDLAKNPWSAPLLHPRFKDSVKFRLWNTTEQLDGVGEMKGWREMRLFNSGGVKYGSAGTAKQAQQDLARRDEADGDLDETDLTDGPRDDKVAAAEAAENRGEEGGDGLAASAEAALSRARELSANSTRVANVSVAATVLPVRPTPKSKDALFERVGSSATEYDRLSVVLSDMARFVLTHRFGGVYLDADTILLRDWTELFNWHGAFAYRWSRLEKYNTAVLKMSRGSAIGNLIFRTAVANGLDFHPMTVSRYTKDAGVEGLLLRLPDALFDPAWLNTEYYQRDRPPHPYFERFEDFFETPKKNSADAVATGFDSFFKGSFSYHFHNFWWKPFDPSRNFPDLGPRFAAGERLARGLDLVAKMKSDPSRHAPQGSGSAGGPSGPSPTKPSEGVTGKDAAPGPTGGRGSTGAGTGGERAYRWGDDPRDFDDLDWTFEEVDEDSRDLSWATVLKRTFEAFVRGERPNMYGEWMNWEEEY